MFGCLDVLEAHQQSSAVCLSPGQAQEASGGANGSVDEPEVTGGYDEEWFSEQEVGIGTVEVPCFLSIPLSGCRVIHQETATL